MGNPPGAYGPSTTAAGLSGATATNSSGVITSYAGQPTAGQGVAPILAVQTTTPTTPVGATNILAAAPAGLYEIDVYFVVTTPGTVGTGITLNLSWTDAQGARTDSTLTVTGLVAGQVMKATFFVEQQAAGAISYTITETGAFTVHPVLAGFVVAKRLN